jgi:hypothetical protein
VPFAKLLHNLEAFATRMVTWLSSYTHIQTITKNKKRQVPSLLKIHRYKQIPQTTVTSESVGAKQKKSQRKRTLTKN